MLVAWNVSYSLANMYAYGRNIISNLINKLAFNCKSVGTALKSYKVLVEAQSDSLARSCIKLNFFKRAQDAAQFKGPCFNA